MARLTSGATGRLRPAWAAVRAGLLAAALSACTAAGIPVEPVGSLKEARFAGIVRQQHDFSCGAAAMATLLNGYYGTHYTELQLLDLLRARYDPAGWKKRQEAGLSLDDLAYIAGRLGFNAEGAAVGISGLLKIKGPVIVHLVKDRFEHFSVFRGTKDGTVLLADPIFGDVRYAPGDFRSQYSGIAMAVWKEGTDLPADFRIAVGPKDSRDQATQARNIANRRYEPMPTRF